MMKINLLQRDFQDRFETISRDLENLNARRKPIMIELDKFSWKIVVFYEPYLEKSLIENSLGKFFFICSGFAIIWIYLKCSDLKGKKNIPDFVNLFRFFPEKFVQKFFL